jgi:hypothetical protein
VLMKHDGERDLVDDRGIEKYLHPARSLFGE